MPNGTTNRPDVVTERFAAETPPRIFEGLVDASAYLDQAYPGNELAMEPDGWYVKVFGGEVARLVEVK
jgi:hypothetical protein